MIDNFTVTIDAGKSRQQYWKDIWSYRELLFFLAWRDILVRYKQTAIGIAWSVLRPFLTMIVFTIVFGKVAKLPSDAAVPYPVMVFVALLPWQFFAHALQESSNSLIANSSMVSKVYFPRLIIPVSSMITSLVDFAISFILLGILMVWYQFIPAWKIALVPLFLLLDIFNALGLGLWFAALNVTYRDFRYIIPFVIQFGLYISPVGFSSSIVPEAWRFLYSLNPMVGVIDGFRWAILGGNELYLPGFVASVMISIFVFYTGVKYFRKTEKTFADVI
jgi:lipopolysaccharide transport system permease protein